MTAKWEGSVTIKDCNKEKEIIKKNVNANKLKSALFY